MEVKINESWKPYLEEEFKKDYFKNLVEFVKKEYKEKKVYPPPKDIFRAFDLCDFKNVKVVILGQDPYHGRAQANGLAFSVGMSINTPPSLQNIFKEIEQDLGVKAPLHGNLDYLANQGILLLNSTLTVVADMAGSHQYKGWEEFTDAVVKILSEKKENLVFLLWGKYAQEKGKIINESRHLVLRAAHPSPFSAYNGFFGCKHFSKTNEYLESKGKGQVKWVE